MGRERSNQDSYTGRGGQLAVLAELLMRLCNVAIPEVDEGQDVLVFLTDLPDVTRLQVKSANAEPLKEEGRFAARVSIPLAQLHDPMPTILHYLFAIRLQERWVDFVILERKALGRLAAEGVGYVNHKAGELQLHLSFGPDSLVCSRRDFQPNRNAWHLLPTVQARTAPFTPTGES